MARQASAAKMGFYPADPFCVESIMKHLKLPAATGSRGVQIIDPCCGKGFALNQIAEGLGIPQDQVYAVELDGNRVLEAKALMPEAKIVGPASFLGMRMTSYSFGLAYVNPPFDSELGGGRREEQAFVEEAHRILGTAGVLVLVCPLTAINGNSKFCTYLDAHFENMRVFSFPDGTSETTGLAYRSFKEVVIIATKRRVTLNESDVYTLGTLHQMSINYMSYPNWESILPRINDPNYVQIVSGKRHKTIPHVAYTAPPTWRPTEFRKSNYLPHELVDALKRSPLNRILNDIEPIELARPPLPPGRGHVALLLAAGMLDGVVEAEDGNHVVRGTAKKVEYFNEEASSSEENVETGALTTKDVYSQKVVLVIRAAWQDGTIITLSDAPEEKPEDDDEQTSNEGRGDRFPDIEISVNGSPFKAILSKSKDGKIIELAKPGSDQRSQVASIYAAAGMKAPWE